VGGDQREPDDGPAAAAEDVRRLAAELRAWVPLAGTGKGSGGGCRRLAGDRVADGWDDLGGPAGQRLGGRGVVGSPVDEAARVMLEHGGGELVDPLLDTRCGHPASRPRRVTRAAAAPVYLHNWRLESQPRFPKRRSPCLNSTGLAWPDRTGRNRGTVLEPYGPRFHEAERADGGSAPGLPVLGQATASSGSVTRPRVERVPAAS